MTNYSHGVVAESKAVAYLKQGGYQIIEQNWKTSWCEIDIIAKRKSKIYFVEVKYRLHDNQGMGLDYITSKKLQQMARAAEGWVQAHDWQEDYQLAVIEVSGDGYAITNFITDI